MKPEFSEAEKMTCTLKNSSGMRFEFSNADFDLEELANIETETEVNSIVLSPQEKSVDSITILTTDIILVDTDGSQFGDEDVTQRIFITTSNKGYFELRFHSKNEHDVFIDFLQSSMSQSGTYVRKEGEFLDSGTMKKTEKIESFSEKLVREMQVFASLIDEYSHQLKDCCSSFVDSKIAPTSSKNVTDKDNLEDSLDDEDKTVENSLDDEDEHVEDFLDEQDSIDFALIEKRFKHSKRDSLKRIQSINMLQDKKNMRNSVKDRRRSMNSHTRAGNEPSKHEAIKSALPEDAGDEWGIIEKIFSAANVEGDGTLDCDEIMFLIRNVSGPSGIRDEFFKEKISGLNEITKEDLHTILFKRKKRSTVLEKLPIFILMWFLPFLCFMSTRIPLIFLALEITKTRGGSYWQVGIILGTYQACLGIANLTIATLGGKDPFKRLEIPMLLTGLFGWLFSLAHSNSSSVWSLFALCSIGFSETTVNLQRSLILEIQQDSPANIIDQNIVASWLRYQYGAVSAGCAAGYVLGGLVYTYFGFTGTCWLGTLCQISQLIGTFIYLSIAKDKKRVIQEVDLNMNDIIRSMLFQLHAKNIITNNTYRGAPSNSTLEYELNAATKMAEKDHILQCSLRSLFKTFFSGEGENSSFTENEFLTYFAPRVWLSVFGSAQQRNVTVVWPYMKVIVFTQFIMVLCIGTFQSTVLLSYNERFDFGASITSIVGILLGVGEVFAMLIILANKQLSSMANKISNGETKKGFQVLQVLLSRPLHVPFILFILSIATMGFTIPFYPTAIFCQLLMNSFDNLSVSLLSELIGTSLPSDKFKYYQGIGQWLRRLGNMATGILGPILFEVNQSLPFLIFGFIVFFWALILWYVMLLHAQNIQNSAKNEKSTHSKNCSPFKPFMETSKTPWHVLEQQYFVRNRFEIERELKTNKSKQLEKAKEEGIQIV